MGGGSYCLTDKINPNQLLILIKINHNQLSIISQVNSSTQLQPMKSLVEFNDLQEMFTLMSLEKD